MQTTTMPPEPVPPTDIERVFSLLAIIKDPEAAKLRLEQIAAASAEVRELLKELAQTKTELTAERANLKRAAQVERENMLANGRNTLEQERQRGAEEFAKRESEIAARERAAYKQYQTTLKVAESVRKALDVDTPLATENAGV